MRPLIQLLVAAVAGVALFYVCHCLAVLSTYWSH